MERIFYLLKQSLFVKFALVATLVIGGGNFAWGEELTVTSSTYKTYTADVPIAGNLLNSTLVKAEFIIPASKLTELKGKEITKMAFTLYSATTGWGDAEFQVFLKEVSNSSYPSPVTLLGNEGATIVYEGQLDATKTTIDVNFTTAFDYGNDGNNLLVGVYCTKMGTAASVYFKLIRDNSSDYNYYSGYTNSSSGSLTRTNWYPETTFTYQDPPASTPVLSVTPINVDFGSLYANGVNTITVTNAGVGTMDVTISNDNTTDFTISDSSLTGIGAGESQTFDITFNYDSSKLGDKSAIIIVTPSYNAGDAVMLNATANAVSDNAPQMFISPDGNIDFGNVYSGVTTFTVTNTGTGQMSVNISSDNGDFTVSPSLIEGLGNGESETFTVTYTFAATADKLGVNSANITVTPTYDVGEAQTYQVSATSNATMTLDEDNVTTVNYGTKNYILVKYQPSAGWNTISMPFVLRTSLMNNMDAIFGVGWKAYTLSSYSNGTLSFSKVSESANVNYGTPYLVYISDAPVHPNGVLLADISTYGNNPSSTSKNGITFQGTYVRKDYVDGDEWYGVTSSGQVLQAGEGAYVKGYRAYFTGISDPADGSRISIVLEGDGTTTDMGFVKMVDKDATDVYTLSGQKVQKAGKGLYIVNGRKVVIK